MLEVLSPIHPIISYAKAGSGVPAPVLFEKAWDECIELQVMDKNTWVARSLLWIQETDRYQIGFYHEALQRVIGGLTLAEDDDPHVGRCLTVTSSYIEPEFRGVLGLRMYRQAVALARRLGFPVLAYTHRQRDWVYTTTYRRL